MRNVAQSAPVSTIDVMIEDHGSIVILQPVSPAGWSWLRENITIEPWQQAGNGVACDPRMVDTIGAEMVAAGLVVTL